jgi:hypothetical protein
MSGNLIHLDGSRKHQRPEDLAVQREVAEQLERAWSCTMREYGDMHHIDWYALRYGRVMAYLELKARNVLSSEYPTVYLAVDKWLPLSLLTLATRAPGFFVVRFLDGIRWIRISRVDARRQTYGGSRTEKEPMIEVPITEMRRIASAENAAERLDG